jgi:DMSO/TMAO reductase YedYZ molybdopterin-dependent catalytic subunit
MPVVALFVALLLQPPAAAATVSVSYADRTVRLTVEDLMKMPQVRATVKSHNVEGTYEGPQLRDVLAAVGAPNGEALRGPGLRLVVAVDAADGYRAVFSLAEIDPAFRDRQILLAIRRNGQPLEASEGPFRLIVVDEARPARWVRQVTGIKVLDVGQM